MNASQKTKILGLAALALGIPACAGGQAAPQAQTAPQAKKAEPAATGAAPTDAATKAPEKGAKGAEMSCGANGCGGK